MAEIISAIEVLNWFAEFGKDPAIHANGTREDPMTRAQRIANEIGSGVRTSEEVRQIIQSLPEPQGPQALPAAAQLVRVGNTYRVVWGLGDGTWAWYDINGTQLTQLYGSTNPQANFSFSNEGAFESNFGDFYWGNVAEINLKAQTPWQSLKNQIQSQFGFVPGMDDPDIQRLLNQAYFEGWSPDQFFVEYRNTSYYNNTLQSQRQWSQLSEAEKQRQIQETSLDLANRYFNIWGRDADPNGQAIRNSAFQIASGQMPIEQWVWQTEQEASIVTGTPTWRQRQAEEEAQLAFGNEAEDLGAMSEQLWRDWIGPVDIPDNFARSWGQRLAAGKVSRADLESYVKEISQARWQFKPGNIAWADWAAPFKSQIRNLLELGSINDNDPMLAKLLSSDLSGQDVEALIRQDQRFLSTSRMYNELSSQAEEIGRRFGFIT